MEEYLTANLECMSMVSIKYGRAWFIMLATGNMVVAIDWTNSKAVAITALEIFVFTQMVPWWKLKKCCQWKEISNYPDRCIFCLKSFSVGCMSLVKKVNDCMACIICSDFFHLYIFTFLINSLMSTCFTSNCFFFSKQMTKASCFM